MPQTSQAAPRVFSNRLGGTVGLATVMLAVIVTCVIAALLVKMAEALLTNFNLKPDAHDEIYAFALVSTFLSLWLLMAPVFGYLSVGQTKKVEVIRGFYSPDLISEYFDQFWSGRGSIADLVYRWRNGGPTQRDTLAIELDERFRSIIVEDFGSGRYVIPALILIAVGFIVLFFGFAGGIAYAESLLRPSNVLPPLMPLGLRLDMVSVAAIFGAYTWVTSDSITRAHQWTFHPSDLAWYTLRLLIAVPLGQAIAAATTTGASPANPGVGAFLAFVVSMFSLDAIQKYLSAAAARVSSTPAGSPDERNDVVVKMVGVDQSSADSLRAEGISTIAQLTAVDPVRISIFTGLPFEYVLRLIDSAILWTFFRDKSEQLREFGIRGASGLLTYSESTAIDMALAASALTDAMAALRACQQQVEVAAANLGIARTEAGTDPMTLEAAEAALAQIQAESDQAGAAERLRAMEAKVAALRRLRDCQSTLDIATARRDAASEIVSAANAALHAAAVKDALFDSIQTKVGISALGLGQAIAQLTVDAYAQFIRRLLGVRP
jgi:hypothetical protein